MISKTVVARIGYRLQQPLAVNGAEHLLEVRWHDPEAGIDEAGAASRGAVADLDRFKDGDVDAALVRRSAVEPPV